MLRIKGFMAALMAGLALTAFLLFPVDSLGKGGDNNERGRTLYTKYCASCHGMDAKGNGPVASSMKTMPTDLTTIAQRQGGWNAIRVQNAISGDAMLVAHGTREMPVWGVYFRSTRDRSVASLNVYALTKYLQSIQH